MTKNLKKSTFLLRVEKSGVVPSVLVVVRLTPKGKNKRVCSKPTRLPEADYKCTGFLKVFLGCGIRLI